jgi:GNAT superfamily N-acetyltransferase
MQLTSILFDQAAMVQYSALFATCFPDAKHFTPEYLRWLYVDNPDGRAFGFDARANGVLAAHYVCIPAQARIEGRVVRVLLSLNTATHPQFQGQGLFTRLAAMTFDAAAADGYEGVYGVANANSTPGFIRKLGFQLVRPLEALVGVGRIGSIPLDSAETPAFERIWSQSALDWRCANPHNPVARRRYGNHWQFFAAAFGPLVHSYGEVVPLAGEYPVQSVGSAPLTPLRLYLGLMPDTLRRSRWYISIPQLLRPSPLNLIYRSLANPGGQLDPSRIHFSFLDFDAY